jgi:hypothetical protein
LYLCSDFSVGVGWKVFSVSKESAVPHPSTFGVTYSISLPCPPSAFSDLQNMSLPWRFPTVNDYVTGTLKNLRGKSESFTHLNIGKYYLQGSELETSHMVALFREAAKNPNIEEISFCGVSLEREALPAMMDMLTRHARKKISFNACRGCGIEALPTVSVELVRLVNSEMTEADFAALGRHVEHNTVLARLELFELQFFTGTMHAQSLARGLEMTSSLRMLELSYCTLHEDAIRELSRGLSRNSSLESLYVVGCELEDDQLAILMAGVSHHRTLQHLKLFRNHCGASGASKIADLLLGGPEVEGDTNDGPPSGAALRSLDLSYQQFERAGKLDVRSISQSLSNNRAMLTILKMSFNKLNDVDAEIIAVGLRNNRTLRELDLRANKIRHQGIVALAENVVRPNNSLVKLFLFGNPIIYQGAMALLDAIQENVTIEVLNMDFCTVSYNAIQFYTCLNRAGRRLLRDNSLNPALWPMVLERAKKVSTGSMGACSHADLIFQLVCGPALSI